MLPNLDILKKKCEILGLEPKQTGRRPSKDDYVQVLRKYFMPEEGLPYTEITPMLCYAEWNLKLEEGIKVWESPVWCAQKKLNGCRMIIHFVKGKGVYAHGRNVSVKTFRYEEYSDRFLFKDSYVPDFDAVVDTEVIIEKPITTSGYTTGKKGEVTKSSLHSTSAVMALEAKQAKKLQEDQAAPLIFQTFDLLSLRGVDLRRKPLSARLIFLETFRKVIEGTVVASFFEFPEVKTSNKRKFFERIVEEGGEGIILKNLCSTYEDSSSRSRLGWVKVKKRIEFDAFVSGFKPGDLGSGWENLVGALEFSVNTEAGTHVLGYASNVTLEQRKVMTETVDGKPSLKKEYLGRVAQISGQDISARSLRLSHCTIDRWREGVDVKLADECRVSMEDLTEASAWVG